MSPIKIWIKAFRLRTLPLSLSGVITGSFLAAFYGFFRWEVFVLSAFTALLLQVLSNLANDYGDAQKGTDNQNRIGPQRTVQSGLISKRTMMVAILFLTIFTFCLGIILIYFSLREAETKQIIIFVLLGITAIAASIFYTIGKKAYGYYGMGDLFVFLFFGLIAVLGTFFLHAQQLPVSCFLPAYTIGCFSVGVLNCNNMRDIENDRASNKKTVAVILGLQNAKTYHFFLILSGWIASLIFVLANYKSPWQALFIITFPLFYNHLMIIYKTEDCEKTDPELKRLAILIFIFSILFAVGMVV